MLCQFIVDSCLPVLLKVSSHYSLIPGCVLCAPCSVCSVSLLIYSSLTTFFHLISALYWLSRSLVVLRQGHGRFWVRVVKIGARSKMRRGRYDVRGHTHSLEWDLMAPIMKILILAHAMSCCYAAILRHRRVPQCKAPPISSFMSWW